VLAPLAQTPGQPANAAPAGNGENGKKLFASVGCLPVSRLRSARIERHRAAPRPRPIAFAAFSRYVRQPTGQMPPYTAKVVSDTDLTNIFAFIRSRPEPAKETPLLRP
jgi:ubiquinol-cytochrome c reductase cytochrome c subunit